MYHSPQLQSELRGEVFLDLRVAGSNHALHFAIALLIVATLAKTFSISEVHKSACAFFTTCTTAHTYNQNSLEGYFWTYSTCRIRWVVSILLCPLLVPALQVKTFPIFRFSKFRPNHFTFIKTSFPLDSEPRERLFLDLFNTLNPTLASIFPITLLIVVALAKTSTISEAEKFRSHLIFLRCDSQQPSLESSRRVFLDLFDELNHAGVSIAKGATAKVARK